MFKKFFVKIAAFATCAVALGGTLFGGLSACSETEPELYNFSKKYYGYFNTDAELVLQLPEMTDKGIQLSKDINDLLYTLQCSFDAGLSTSKLYAFNAAAAGAKVEIDEHCYNVLQIAQKMYAQTDGFYNPGVYYSVDLYGFSAREAGVTMPYDREDPSKQLPAEKYVSAFEELGESFADLSLEYDADSGKYYAIKPEKTVTVDGDPNVYSLRIDLGGIGKGYAADLVDELIDEAGFEYSYFNFGSSTMTINKDAATEDEQWPLGFHNARGGANEYYIIWKDSDTSTSTSGDNEKYYIIDGKRYCHIVNPKTGSPISTGIITASCSGGDAAEADARTTAICAMGLERALEYINSADVKGAGIKASFLYEDQDGELTVYTNMEEGDYEIVLGQQSGTTDTPGSSDQTPEIPSWVFILICAGFVVVVFAGWLIYKKVQQKRESAEAGAENEYSGADSVHTEGSDKDSDN